jgi:hypothetical protein
VDLRVNVSPSLTVPLFLVLVLVLLSLKRASLSVRDHHSAVSSA